MRLDDRDVVGCLLVSAAVLIAFVWWIANLPWVQQWNNY